MAAMLGACLALLLSRADSHGSLAEGVLSAKFELQKQFDLSLDPEAEWDIGEYTDEHLTHSCANYVNDGSTVSSRDKKLVLNVSSACKSGDCLNSARLMSKESFKYGLYVFKAQVPKCNFVWPAIWLLPEDKDGNGDYGGWPCSGEIDVLETVDDHNFGTFNLVAGRGSDVGCSGHEFTCNRCRPGFCVSSSLQNSSSGAYFVEDVNCSAGARSWREHTWVMHWQPDKLTTWLDPSLEKDDAGRIAFVTPKISDMALASGFPTWKTYDRDTTSSWSSLADFMDQCYPSVATASAPFDAGFKLVLNIAIGGYEGAGCRWGEGCSTACAAAVGSELVLSEISVWQEASEPLLP